MDEAITALESQGITLRTQRTGLGDVVEETLETLGITQEKFKQWFNLKECNCEKRKKWLNNLFSWEANRRRNNRQIDKDK